MRRTQLEHASGSVWRSTKTLNETPTETSPPSAVLSPVPSFIANGTTYYHQPATLPLSPSMELFGRDTMDDIEGLQRANEARGLTYSYTYSVYNDRQVKRPVDTPSNVYPPTESRSRKSSFQSPSESVYLVQQESRTSASSPESPPTLLPSFALHPQIIQDARAVADPNISSFGLYSKPPSSSTMQLNEPSRTRLQRGPSEDNALYNVDPGGPLLQEALVLVKVGDYFIQPKAGLFGGSKHVFVQYSGTSAAGSLFWSTPDDHVPDPKKLFPMSDIYAVTPGLNTMTPKERAGIPEEACLSIINRDNAVLILQASSVRLRDAWVKALATIIETQDEAKETAANPFGLASNTFSVLAEARLLLTVGAWFSKFKCTKPAFTVSSRSFSTRFVYFGCDVVRGDAIYWAKSLTRKYEARRSMLLRDIRAVLIGSESRCPLSFEQENEFCFSVSDRSRTLRLAASSRALRDNWVSALLCLTHGPSSAKVSSLRRSVLLSWHKNSEFPKQQEVGEMADGWTGPDVKQNLSWVGLGIGSALGISPSSFSPPLIQQQQLLLLCLGTWIFQLTSAAHRESPSNASPGTYKMRQRVLFFNPGKGALVLCSQDQRHICRKWLAPIGDIRAVLVGKKTHAFLNGIGRSCAPECVFSIVVSKLDAYDVPRTKDPMKLLRSLPLFTPDATRSRISSVTSPSRVDRRRTTDLSLASLPGEPLFFLDLVANHTEERDAWVSAILALMSFSSSPSSGCNASSSSHDVAHPVRSRHPSISSSQVRIHNISNVPTQQERASRTTRPSAVHPKFAVPA